MSALARHYLSQKWTVTGSDLVASEITRDLEKKGARIFYKHKKENLAPDTQLVIRSAAVPKDNPEIEETEKREIKSLTYPQAVGELTRKYRTIAVSGAHGKGTTTAFAALILIKAGLDPTVIIGTNLPQFDNSNYRPGKSRYLLLEADEYQKAFLSYDPEIIITTNIDKEHLDCYENLDEIKDTFVKFWKKLSEQETLIVNKDNPQISTLEPRISNLKTKIIRYSLQDKNSVQKIRKVISIPGRHNVSNALAALTLAREIGIQDTVSLKAVSEYKGGWRRFQVVQQAPFVVISDYAHHPTEIKATLQAARERYPDKKIWAVFQPHQYQRTHYLYQRFPPAFKQADEIVLTEIYSVPGREKKEIKEKVSGKKLADEIKSQGRKVTFIKNYLEIPEFLNKKTTKKDVVLVMGAGNIYKIVQSLIE